ncbi:diacylglycerol kinase [Psychroflexus halocasei]|uniref:Diacylglycerol kinase (ATP) n=1 Tax=Psychroflexus halocasei TaxID=908615 RepID=A0A1H3ZYJ9_9FLAO|nr:diacylglycerol kinase family protein [Psychroflexus halocasei]SEA28853.1 diacylglycerol kinase (ATP) [Psychroflexus halocasei]
MKNFLFGRWRAITPAWKGFLRLLKEDSVKVQIFIGFIVSIIGFIVGITKTEFLIQTLAIAMVLGAESFNTAIEEVADFIHPELHPKIGLIKDIAAGAVFMVCIFAILIGLYIYFPYLFLMLF